MDWLQTIGLIGGLVTLAMAAILVCRHLRRRRARAQAQKDRLANTLDKLENTLSDIGRKAR